MRVMTWNVWWKFGPWEQRQPAIEATIRDVDPDVVCLQEVIGAEDDRPDQATMLGERLGYHVATSFAPERPWMANAVLSRWPIVETDVLALPTTAGRRPVRSAVLAVADAPFGAVPVVSTHLAWQFDASGERCDQAKAIGAWLRPRHDKAAFPILLCGDLNARPDADEMRLLTGLAPGLPARFVFQDAWERANGPFDLGYTWAETNPYKEGTQWPGRRLDYVLVAVPRTPPAGNVLGCRLAGVDPVDGVVGSDHFAVVADIDTPEV